MRRIVLMSLVVWSCAAGPALAATGFDVDDPTPRFALAGPEVTPPAITLATSSLSSFGETPGKAKKSKKKKGKLTEDRGASGAADAAVFSAQRAQILLRSLTVPGWGQATMGRRHAAAYFGAAELGIWTAFTAFRVQEVMRANTYMRTARLFAGIDLSSRDDEFRRIVGSFSSSDEYNLLVVARDAANIYMQDVYHPDMAGYRAYIAAHSLTGADTWRWSDEQSFLRYVSQRKAADRASIRANTALAVAIANRLVSAVHAAYVAGKASPQPAHTSWNVDFTPGQPGERVLFRSGLSVRF